MHSSDSIIELVNAAISRRQENYPSTALLEQIFTGTGNAMPSAAEIFDAFAYPGREALRSELEQYLELVAAPRSFLHSLEEGDIIVRRAEAGLGHIAFVADAERRHYEQLRTVALNPETHRVGKYVQVVEGGVRPHTLADKFARHIVDAEGRLPYDQLVLRPHEHFHQRIMEDIPIEQAAPTTFNVGRLVPARRFVEMPLTYEDFITNATGSGIVIRRTRCDTLADVRTAARRPMPLDYIVTIGGITHNAVITHADLIRSMSAATPSLLWQVTSADRLQAALDLVIFYPADPADPNKLAPGSTRFPLAIIIHGNHNVCERSAPTAPCWPRPSGVPVETLAPLSPGGDPRARFETATFGPEIPNHMGYCGATPAGLAWSNVAGINAGPAVTPYLQEELARHGIISVSVSTNAANFFDLHLETRADLLLKAVAEMRRFDSDRSSLFFHRIDFNKLAFVGHSRGGDAIIRAALKQRSLNVKALVQLAPTDVTGLLAGTPPSGAGGPRIDFVSSPMSVSSELTTFQLIIYGSRDGDVSGFQDVRVGPSVHPFRHYDRSSTQRAFFFWHGATHNRFNRFWSDDDECRVSFHNLLDLSHPAGLLDRNDQEARTRELVVGCLRFVLNGEMGERDRLNGRVLSTIAPARPMSAMWKLGRALKTIDIFDDPRSDRNTLGGRNRPPASGLVDEIRLANDNPAGAGVTAFQFMHIDRVLRAAFTSTPVPGVSPAPGGAPLPPTTPPTATLSGRWRADIPSPDQNFSSFTLITLRVTKKWDPAAITIANRPVVKIRLVDTGGHAHEELAAGRISALPAVRRITYTTSRPSCIPASRPWPPPGLPPTVDLTKFHFETWEVELSSYASAGVNLHHVAAVEVESVGLAGQPVYVDTISLIRL